MIAMNEVSKPRRVGVAHDGMVLDGVVLDGRADAGEAKNFQVFILKT